MNYCQIFNIVSILMLILCAVLMVPFAIAVGYGEAASASAFGYTVLGAGLIFFTLFWVTRRKRVKEFRIRDGLLAVSLSWLFAAAVGSLPYVFSGAIPSLADAFFETMSGLTTTGASVLTEIESLPRSVLFWRALTHWIGGMGIVVLTIAILPLLGVSGLNLMKAEAPGPTVEKISDKIATTAKVLWLIYVGLTVLETLFLLFGGLSFFDALTHSFATLATGGFSTRNSSVAAFHSAYVDWVVTVFMLLAGINFALIFRLLTGHFRTFFKNSELQAYLLIVVLASLVIAVNLTFSKGGYGSFGESLRYSAFQVASIITTTGFASADYTLWPAFSQFIVFLLMFVGGCAGSTAGGIKVVRLTLLQRMARKEFKQLIHPQGVFAVKMNGRVVDQKSANNAAVFVFLYFLFLLLTTGVVAFFGSDLLTAFSAALATVGNIGPGFGRVGPVENYSFFAAPVKWFLSFAMMAGRLELFTVFVLFMPKFWKNR